MNTKQKLYVFGTPGKTGGAATRIQDLLPLLKERFDICVVLPRISFMHDAGVTNYLNRLGIPYYLRKDLPDKAEGVALGICELDLFTSGTAERIQKSGLKLIWSNEMMWAFKGEAEAVRAGIVDRVLFVSEIQQQAFADLYRTTDQRVIPNYISPEHFPFVERKNCTFTLGRLSRPDRVKYPVNFPVFYEELGLRDVKYRVQAWSEELRSIFRWHTFGPEWELYPANKIPTAKFLQSLDLFVYPLGHRFIESWGRSTVEAMLSGCVPIVPAGHHFHNLMTHQESGFICKTFAEFKDCVQALHRDGRLRKRISNQAAHHARTALCNVKAHSEMWTNALTFN